MATPIHHEARQTQRRIEGALARRSCHAPVLKRLHRMLVSYRRAQWGTHDLAYFLREYRQWIDHNCRGAAA